MWPILRESYRLPPKGSKGRVMQGARVLGAHHFAFVRESLLGLDLAESFHRYPASSETTTDVRHVQHRRDELLKHIIEAGRQLDARLEPQAKITPLLELLSRDAVTTPVAPLPALDEWIASESIDRQYWREDGQVAAYKVAFGIDCTESMALMRYSLVPPQIRHMVIGRQPYTGQHWRHSRR
jgi:hypothetical protein